MPVLDLHLFSRTVSRFAFVLVLSGKFREQREIHSRAMCFRVVVRAGWGMRARIQMLMKLTRHALIWSLQIFAHRLKRTSESSAENHPT